MTGRLHHIAIICSDRSASLRFYGALGFTVTEVCARPERGDEIIFMSGHGISLELFAVSNRPERPTSPEAYGLRHIALVVDDVAAACGELCAVGYQPEAIRSDSRTGELMTFVKDPDGLPIELRECLKKHK